MGESLFNTCGERPGESLDLHPHSANVIHLAYQSRPPRSIPEKALPVEQVLSHENLLTSGASLLTLDEMRQSERYVFEKDQWSLVASRKLTRNLMIQLHPNTGWTDWYWEPDELGKPRFSNPEHAKRWKFNLAHTRDAVACIVARENEVGIDIENWTRPAQCLELSQRFFSKQETQELKRFENDPTQLSRRFFAIWTLKEAFVKALGLGLRFPLDAFSINLPDELPGGEITNNTVIPFQWTPSLPTHYKHLPQQSRELRLWSCHPNLWIATCVQGGQSKNLDFIYDQKTKLGLS